MIEVKLDNARAGWEQWILLLSDNHNDSPLCDRKLQRKHLNIALERDAIILFGGDEFDAMGGRYDPRRSMEGVRPEDMSADYLDKIVLHAAEEYAPYAKNIAMIGMGNHETAVQEHNSTNLTSSLVHRLNSDYGGKIIPAGIRGWVLFRINLRKTVHLTKRLYWHHGADGASPVSRGLISTNRQAVWLPDADIVWNGHNHQGYHVPISRERCNQYGNVSYDVVHFVRTPGYLRQLDAVGGMAPQYAERKAMSPTPSGCVWLRLVGEDDTVSVRVEIDVV